MATDPEAADSAGISHSAIGRVVPNVS